MTYKDISPEIALLAHQYQYQESFNVFEQWQALVQMLWQWAQEVLYMLHIKIPGISDNRPLSLFLQFVLFLAGAGGVFLFANEINKRFKISDRQPRTAPLHTEKSIFNLQIEADKEAEQGNFKNACRLLYLVFLQLLDKYEIAIFAPTKTNYEYSYMLLAYPELQQGFQQIVNVVEFVWFGNKEASHSDFQICKQIIQTVEEEVQRRKSQSYKYE